MNVSEQKLCFRISKLSINGLFILLLFSGSACATLISVADPLFGADSVIRQNNGREWLDHNFSRGCSFEKVSTKTDCGFVFSGWRHANRAEILDLWFEAGFTPGNYSWGDEFIAIGTLAALLNAKVAVSYGDVQVYGLSITGLFDDSLDGLDNQQVGIAHLSALTFDNSDAASANINLDAFDISDDGEFISNWLVRDAAIPEPTTAALLSLGFAVFCFRFLGYKTRH